MKKILLTILVFGTILGSYLWSPQISHAQLTTQGGGTGLTNTYTAGDLIYAATNNPIRFSKLPIGGNGTCLGVTSGLPSYITCGSGGGGSSGGTWSTTTSQVSGRLINYSNNTTDIVTVGGSATTTGAVWLDPNTLVNYFKGNVGIGTTSPYALLSVAGQIVGKYFTATSSTASQLPYATSTAMTITNLFATNLSNLTTNGFVKTSGGTGVLSVDTNTYLTGSGAGVTDISVVSTNGFAGSSSGGATPALTLSTSITGVLKGNGTAISAAANGTDYTLVAGSATCTNQFLRSISASGVGVCATVGSADVTLANLTATDSTLTFSGTYNGSTARTIGINLGNNNVWTASTTFQQQTNLQRASSTILSANTFCLTADVCRTTWPSGSGGGSGTWSTTTSQVPGQLINYPNNNTDIVTFGGTATSTAFAYFDPNIKSFKIGTSLGIQSDAFGTKPLEFQVANSGAVNDFVGGNIWNTTAGSQAGSFLAFGNDLTTRDNAAGAASVYYGGIVYASSRWQGSALGFGALPANGLVFYNTDGTTIIASATSTGEIDFYTGAGSFAGGIPDAAINRLGNWSLGAATTTAYRLDVLGLGRFTGLVDAQIFTATSSTLASSFPLASTTAISSTGSAYFATSGGNVGIGTTSPYSSLSVAGATGIVMNSFNATSTAATNATSTIANELVIGGTRIPNERMIEGNRGLRFTRTSDGAVVNAISIDSGASAMQFGAVGGSTFNFVSANTVLAGISTTVTGTGAGSTGYLNISNIRSTANNPLIITSDGANGLAGVTLDRTTRSSTLGSSLVSMTYAGTEQARVTIDGSLWLHATTTTGFARLGIVATSSASSMPLIQIQTPTTAGVATTTVFKIDANGLFGIGTSTTAANLQATTITANATTSIQFGKANQNKGTCLTYYDSAGTPVYAYIPAGTTAFTLTSTQLSGCQN